jgi:hypothetical protein
MARPPAACSPSRSPAVEPIVPTVQRWRTLATRIEGWRNITIVPALSRAFSPIRRSKPATVRQRGEPAPGQSRLRVCPISPSPPVLRGRGAGVRGCDFCGFLAPSPPTPLPRVQGRGGLWDNLSDETILARILSISMVLAFLVTKPNSSRTRRRGHQQTSVSGGLDRVSARQPVRPERRRSRYNRFHASEWGSPGKTYRM